MRFLELFSGIGGMHVALKESGIDFEVVLAVDINEVANKVYKYNFPETKLLQKNIQSLTKTFIDELDINGILMSPPCQPFTRLGNKKDIEDKRCSALSHLTDLIPELDTKLKYILLENVKGFEVSEARNALVKRLEGSFEIREFLLTPLNFGIPNSRLRYYLLAKRKPLEFKFDNKLHTFIPGSKEELVKDISKYIELSDNNENNDYTLSLETLAKRVWVIDIVNKTSKNSCCFTKSYGRFLEGTGSLYSPLQANRIAEIRSSLRDCEKESFNKALSSLKLRYFTPTEVKRLMCFNKEYSFPDSVTLKQTYNLLGNSVNVKVVSELLKVLIND
ncbi:tRNA (cytosine(38)-C(5))-methyltransferase [Cimex lectularius]|uniref:Uncharacterized protein n=1 Tax=Cimex lectularius TaxID=79782 RepID=A0A8I6RNZ5_CIMLE|nr:tRNA (cytosine(38)-C(5))-methyltransferase [Cimex lectularius]